MILLRRILHSRLAAFGVSVLAIVAATALLAPFIAPHDAAEQDILSRLLPPMARSEMGLHVLGTDALGFTVIDEPLLLDLSGCEIVDSTGLGVLISLLRRAREANQRCAIIGANPAVTRILVVTGLDQLFEVLDAEHFPDVRVL